MKTAIVINAGLGALALGIERAGYKVNAAYETDKKAISIHEENLDVPVYNRLPQKEDYKNWYEPDLLAARIHVQVPTRNSPRSNYPIREGQQLLEMIGGCHPRTFLFFMNLAGYRNLLPIFLEEISIIGYQFASEVINIGESLGLPIKERTVCFIGARSDIDSSLHFPYFRQSNHHSYSEDIFEIGKPVDPWYYDVNRYRVPYNIEDGRFFCWSNGEYKPTDTLIWNSIRVPLVRDIGRLRRITHREVANLKSYPLDYSFSKERNKSWLYKSLMYSENISIVEQVAKGLTNTKPFYRGLQFENLFFDYLNYLSQKHEDCNFTVERNPQSKDIRYDFKLSNQNQILLFEIKLYNGQTVIPSRINAACKHISMLNTEGTPVLVVANEVQDSIKTQCLEEYGVYIWDIGNLLWLFEDFPEVKSEFIAFLDYAIDSIEAKPPTVSIVLETSTNSDGILTSDNDTDWEKKLFGIEPGIKFFRAYEDVCVDILKYVLGDYLTLWKIQEPSNDGLYRFDLCCRIKAGINQDFFDTIKNYFNTKYIVFEFKNYREKIGQKEIYTTEKYLYEKALRKVAIIISREGADEHAQKAIKGSLRETGKLILCLSDKDLLDMIDTKKQGEQEPADILGNMLDNLLVHLEK